MRNVKSSTVLLLTAVAMTLAFAVPAQAAGASDDDWHFTVPIGFWAFGVSGDVGVKNVSRHIDLSSSDVQDALDKAFGLSLEFGKGKWIYQIAGSHMEFLKENVTGPGSSGASADTTLDWDTVEAAMGYRVAMVNPGPKALIFNILGGVRYVKQTAEIVANNASFDAKKDVNWTDPFVRFELIKSCTEHFGLKFRGDAGGFGISDSQSNLTWNASASAAWRWMYASGWSFAVAGGYQYSSIDYENKDASSLNFKMDVQMDGPTFGVAFSW